MSAILKAATYSRAVMLCSGYGQYHTDSNDRSGPLVEITLTQVRLMVSDPANCEKSQAQWFIPSTLKTRSKQRQICEGRFYALWADIDEMALEPWDSFIESIKRITGNAEALIYTSKSATTDNLKCRVIVPLAEPVSGSDFQYGQRVLNEYLAAEGIEPDRATESANQICYLPNRGQVYQHHICEGGSFNLSSWSLEIDALKHLEAVAEEARKAKMTEAQEKLRQRMENGQKSPVDAFKAAFDVELMLESSGYRKRGNRWLSPYSEGGTPGVVVKGNRWITSHQSDRAAGLNESGDAFDLLVHFQYGGDFNAALKAVGEQFTTPDGLTLTKHNQTAYMQEKELQQVANDFSPEYHSEPFSFKKFALNGSAREMRAKMLNDVYVLGEIAILGQWTTVFAAPNSGKTLLTIWMLIQALKDGRLNGEDVFYVNADDDYKGLVEKLELAETHGFNMVSPGHNGFKSSELQDYLSRMASEDNARGVVLILDTLKKFVDTMDKKAGTKFGQVARQFVSRGGTIIALSHTNKNRDVNGKRVFSGTSDIVDDADCAYTIDSGEGSSPFHQTVTFENFKCRGNVKQSVSYSYELEPENYLALLDSVEELDEDKAAQIRQQQRISEKLEKNAEAIEAIAECIQDGVTQKTDLIKMASTNSGFSKDKIRKVVNEHAGKYYSKGHRWIESKGDLAAAKVLTLLHAPCFASDYRREAEGE